jgi:hypothetical protein
MTSMLLRLGFLSVAVLLCAASGTQKVQRAALVPHQQPIQHSGQPIGDNRGEFALGTSTLSVLTDPEIAPDTNAGLYIPRYHVSGAARLRISRELDMGLLYDQGLNKGKIPIQEGQPPVEHGDVYGGGLTMHYAWVTANPDFSIGLGFDLIFYSVPYVEYKSCLTEVCVDPDALWENEVEKRDNVAVLALGVTPSWRLSPTLAAFGGMTVRNHPTVPRTTIEMPDLGDDDDVIQRGPANFVANAGIEMTFGNGLRGMVHIFQPVYGDPVRYGPTFGAQFVIPLGRDKPAGVAPGPMPAPVASR